MSLRIDSHHHFWHYDPVEYNWIDESMGLLRRDFLPSDLDPLLPSAGIDGTVAVQARQTIAETDWLLQLSRRLPWMLAVVGWLPIASPDFPRELDRFRDEPRLKGLRHVVQAEPSGFLEQAAFNQGIGLLLESGHTFDLLVVSRQLREAIAFVDRHPHQRFVLDHLGKPDIRNGEMESWRKNIHDLARRPHVAAKLSGLITEADPSHWEPATLTPYLDTALEAFGASRLMVGTDWPVLTLGCSYAAWWQLVEAWSNPLSATERASLFGGTAQRVYNISEGQPVGPSKGSMQ